MFSIRRSWRPSVTESNGLPWWNIVHSRNYTDIDGITHHTVMTGNSNGIDTPKPYCNFHRAYPDTLGRIDDNNGTLTDAPVTCFRCLSK